MKEKQLFRDLILGFTMLSEMFFAITLLELLLPFPFSIILAGILTIGVEYLKEWFNKSSNKELNNNKE